MSRIKKVEGIVIRALDYGESHKIVSALSRDHGKISFIAKGARKTESRFGAALELLSLSEFIYYDREGLKTLSQADLIDPFSKIKRDYDRLSTALRCARWVNRLLEEDHEEERVFALFCRLLEALGDDGVDESTLALYELAFKLKSLMGLGWTPTFDVCASCGRTPRRAWFSMEKGGVLCERCHTGDRSDETPLTQGTARGLQMALKLPLHRLKRLKLASDAIALGEQLMDGFIAHHLKPLSSSNARKAPRRG